MIYMMPSDCYHHITRIRVFQKFHFVKKKYCNTSTHPSGVYINQIQKNFFPKSSLEGQTSWSKMVKTPSCFSPFLPLSFLLLSFLPLFPSCSTPSTFEHF